MAIKLEHMDPTTAAFYFARNPERLKELNRADINMFLVAICHVFIHECDHTENLCDELSNSYSVLKESVGGTDPLVSLVWINDVLAEVPGKDLLEKVTYLNTSEAAYRLLSKDRGVILNIKTGGNEEA